MQEEFLIGEMAELLGVPREYELVAFLPVGRALDAAAPVGKLPFAERAWFNTFGAGA